MAFDAFGVEIFPDTLVIYNRSGELALGKVIKIKDTYSQDRYGYSRWNGFIDIQKVQPILPKQRRGFSRVRNMSSVVVINGYSIDRFLFRMEHDSTIRKEL